jgi:colicin import membrane protein
MSETIEQYGELAVIPPSALPTILASDKNDILGKLRDKIAAHKSDASTIAGRKAIASLAHEVATSKMDLIRLGKSLTEDWRAKTKAVNAECAVIEERMDALKEDVRRPLTEYENAEKNRVADHEQEICRIASMVEFDDVPSSSEVSDRITALHNLPERNWQEFIQRAQEAFTAADERLHGKLAQAQKREAAEAEVARLAAQQAERDRQEAIRLQAERESRIAAEAAERAKQEAEAKAAREAAEAAQRVEADRIAAEHKAQVERDRIKAEAQAAEQRAAKAEQDRLDAIEAGKRAAAAAEQREKEAAAQAQRERENASAKAEADRKIAIESERKRAADEQARVEAEAKKREADKAHKSKLLGEAKADLMVAGLDEEMAKKAVLAIARNVVRHVGIRF